MFVWLSEEPPLCVFIVPQRNYRLILKSFFAACIFFCSLYLFYLPAWSFFALFGWANPLKYVIKP